MVQDELDDGVRIAQLVSSEITGHEDPPYDAIAVENADLDVEPTVDGAKAYDVIAEGDVIATMFVHPDRAHLAFRVGLEDARHAASVAGLRVRPKAVEPPRVLVFVENGAEAKRVLGVLAAAAGEGSESTGA